MKKLAVIGNPVSHSLSPAMHNAALNHLNIDCEYVAINVERKILGSFLSNARKNFFGFNVTAPYKAEVIPFLDAVDEECIMSQSVNTVVNKNGTLIGKTTDGYGLEKALEAVFGVFPADCSLFFVGCGGASKAAAVHFLKRGVKQIYFANRTTSKAAAFVNLLKNKYSMKQIDYCALDDHEKINEFLDSNPILIQSTTLGLAEDDPSPFSAELFRSGLRVFDMVYKKTNFLKMAESKGCICADGRLMLLHQGARSFSLWTSLEAPVEIMQKAFV